MAKARPLDPLPLTVEELDRWNAEQPERWELIGGVPVLAETVHQEGQIELPAIGVTSTLGEVYEGFAVPAEPAAADG
jgi:hypothetical protein